MLEPLPWQGLETLCRGDSLNYISQFLSLIEEELPTDPKLLSKDPPPPKTEAFTFTSDRNQGPDPIQKQKKIRKVTNSPFHNYQKHLNNALKKIITLPQPNPLDSAHVRAAQRLWAKYLKSDIKTKKILHSVFNERHESHPNESELRTYDFLDVFVEFGEAVFREAKAYLSRLAVEQITPKAIDDYLLTRKLIKREGFKEYLLEFRQELVNGFLKRRIIIEHAECWFSIFISQNLHLLPHNYF